MKPTHILHTLSALALALLAAACNQPEARLPEQSTAVQEAAQIYPDYRGIVIPPNIAPLNIQVRSAGTAYVGCIEGAGRQLLAAASDDGKLCFDSLEWRGLLEANRGRDLTVTLYARRDSGWVRFPAYTLTVAAEPIDRYLSYRLIEPSYELYRQLGLYQRDLQSFDVHTIYENNRSYSDADNHCVNCHNYQNYSTRRMLFHVRAKHGGTVFIDGGKAVKMNMKCNSVLSNSVYPSWHPQRNWVVFSSNQTGQTFHMLDHDKIEVVDYGSDLVFYDADKQQISNILKTEAELETFPCWSPDGLKVFYCSAHVPEFAGTTAQQRQDIITRICRQVRYNLMSISFDPSTGTFGQPQTEVDCAAMERSCAVPRVSPDGRYVLFTLADFGQFHIWHSSSDLYVKDLTTGEVRPLEAANSKGVDSYHTWSSNGRWIVFSSRRDDGSYTRPYIAYFDTKGQAHKAFILPQADPEQNLLLTKSYNVPELTRDAVSISSEELKECIYADDRMGKVTYRKNP